VTTLMQFKLGSIKELTKNYKDVIAKTMQLLEVLLQTLLKTQLMQPRVLYKVLSMPLRAQSMQPRVQSKVQSMLLKEQPKMQHKLLAMLSILL